MTFSAYCVQTNLPDRWLLFCSRLVFYKLCRHRVLWTYGPWGAGVEVKDREA